MTGCAIGRGGGKKKEASTDREVAKQRKVPQLCAASLILEVVQMDSVHANRKSGCIPQRF
jgi:hypothetical protein